MSRIMTRALTIAVIGTAAQQTKAMASRNVPRTSLGARIVSSWGSRCGFLAVSPAAVPRGQRAGPVGRSARHIPHRRVGAFVGPLSHDSTLLTSGSQGIAMSSTATPVPPLSVAELTLTEESKVKLSVSPSKKGDSWEGDLLVLFAHQQDDKEAFATVAGAAAVSVNTKLEGAVQDFIDLQEFKGAKKSSVTTMLGSKSPVKQIAVIGLGKDEKSATDSATLDSIGVQVAALAKSSKCKSMGIVLPEGCVKEASQALAQGLLIGLYTDTRFKTAEDAQKPLPLELVNIIGGEDAEGLDAAKAVSSGVRLCKDLINAPPNVLTPGSLAEAAAKIAAECGLEAEILEEDEIRARGMGAYMGVAQGAVFPPKFIHLTYRPEGEPVKKVALVGKGLTFDSGGYNIKAGAGSMIELMKFDMGGSACTLGAAKAIGQLKPKGVEAHFIVAACENMVSEKAMRPGDILTASNGKTIEVINTDAEGRLTLADALVFAEGLGVDAIIDSATLTGSCIIALGNSVAGMWSSDETLAKELADVGSETGEKLWRMPLVPDYAEQVKSKIADMKNVGGRAGSSITAALFLKEFVEKTPWAHVDIAGPVWNYEAGDATGYGVRLLTRWVQKQGIATPAE